VDPTYSSSFKTSGSALFCEAEQANTRKHMLKGATMGVSTFGRLGAAVTTRRNF
jgi:hypothetical protein